MQFEVWENIIIQLGFHTSLVPLNSYIYPRKHTFIPVPAILRIRVGSRASFSALQDFDLKSYRVANLNPNT